MTDMMEFSSLRRIDHLMFTCLTCGLQHPPRLMFTCFTYGLQHPHNLPVSCRKLQCMIGKHRYSVLNGGGDVNEL